MPVLNFPLDQRYKVENYLITAISANFLCQLSVLPVLNQPLADQETLPSADQETPIDEDPTPTSSDNERIEEDNLPSAGLGISVGDDDSDDPCYQ
jgi:hypothetical protein